MSNPEFSARLTKTAPAAWLRAKCICGSNTFHEVPSVESDRVAAACSECGLIVEVVAEAADGLRSRCEPKSLQS